MCVVNVLWLTLFAVKIVVDLTAEFDFITLMLPAVELLRIELEIIIKIEAIVGTFFISSRLELFKSQVLRACKHQVFVKIAFAFVQIIVLITKSGWSSRNFRGLSGK